MAKVSMKHIEIIALLTDGKSVVELLQRRGIVDLTQYENTEQQKGIDTFDTSQSIQLFERNSTTVQQSLAILDEYAPEKKSLLTSFEPRTPISTQEFEELAEKADQIIHNAYELQRIHQKISENRANLKARIQYAESLESWRTLEVATKFKGTALTTAFIGTLPGEWDREQLLESLKPDPDTDIPAEVEIVFSFREQSGIFILCHQDYKQLCTQALRKIGFAQPLILTDKPPSDLIEEYRRTADELEQEIKRLTSHIQNRADMRRQLLFALDYLSMRADKYRALQDIAITRQTMIIKGYIPAESADPLAQELNEKYILNVTVTEPDEEDDPPVAFKNSMPAAALEDITSSYNMPSKTDVDPNPVMSFFYYLFFGLMLSDAGYGVLMALACGLILKFKKPEGNMKRNMQKFMLCGLSTVFWGSLFGSWFGSFVLKVGLFGQEISLSPLWFDPVADPMKLLILSFVLGFVQIVVGLGVKFYMLWSNGDRLGAIFDIGFWWVVFAGIVMVLASSMVSVPSLDTVGVVVAVTGAAGLLLTQGRSSPSIPGKILGGLGSLYGITGYFSDILSYCRLMALGLVTGIIGTVVNTIGSMGGKGITGIPLFIIVFIAGHAINLSINALGAYVHCNRLQYVEFFSKFYEGGGRLYSPLKVNTKHYKFKEENTNV